MIYKAPTSIKNQGTCSSLTSVCVKSCLILCDWFLCFIAQYTLFSLFIHLFRQTQANDMW